MTNLLDASGAMRQAGSTVSTVAEWLEMVRFLSQSAPPDNPHNATFESVLHQPQAAVADCVRAKLCRRRWRQQFHSPQDSCVVIAVIDGRQQALLHSVSSHSLAVGTTSATRRNLCGDVPRYTRIADALGTTRMPFNPIEPVSIPAGSGARTRYDKAPSTPFPSTALAA